MWPVGKDWMRGRKWSPDERRKRALGWALAHGRFKPIWTEEREAELLRLVENGLSDREIADRMDTTKAAVNGRRHYLRRGRRLTEDDDA